MLEAGEGAPSLRVDAGFAGDPFWFPVPTHSSQLPTTPALGDLTPPVFSMYVHGPHTDKVLHIHTCKLNENTESRHAMHACNGLSLLKMFSYDGAHL